MRLVASIVGMQQMGHGTGCLFMSAGDEPNLTLRAGGGQDVCPV